MHNTHRVLIEKPSLKELAKKYTVIDLHFHSHYSDGRNTVQEIADKAKALGIGVAITDHNDIRGAIEISNITDIVTIPGIEITSREGAHLLIYFYDIEELKKFYDNDVFPFLGKDLMSSLSLRMEEIICRTKAYEAITIFPHPFGAVYTGICNSIFSMENQKDLLNIVDGIEVFNASILKKSNLKNTILGFNLNKYITAGSDGHNLKHMGKAVTYASCERSCHAFFNAIKNKQNKVVGKEITIFKKVTSTGLKLKNSISNYPNLIEKNIKYCYALFNVKSRGFRNIILTSLGERVRN